MICQIFRKHEHLKWCINESDVENTFEGTLMSKTVDLTKIKVSIILFHGSPSVLNTTARALINK